MPPMDIASLENDEIFTLIDNRVHAAKDFMQKVYDKTRIQEAIDQIKELLFEVEDRLQHA